MNEAVYVYVLRIIKARKRNFFCLLCCLIWNAIVFLDHDNHQRENRKKKLCSCVCAHLYIFDSKIDRRKKSHRRNRICGLFN